MSFIRFWKDRTGSSFIETAILIPMMLMLCCGTMDFARVVYAGIEIASAAGHHYMDAWKCSGKHREG